METSVSIKSPGRPHRRFWRISLLFLVVLPFLPEVLVLATSAIANVAGCSVESQKACAFGRFAAEIIKIATEAGTLVGIVLGLGGVVLWLILCYTSITLGWEGLSRRILLALAIALVFAFLPYFAPALVLEPLVNANCQPNEGGVGPCVIYGGNVGDAAHQTVSLPWVFGVAALLTFATLAIYVVTVIIMRIVSRNRVIPKAI
jgi:hypothetical protein